MTPDPPRQREIASRDEPLWSRRRALIPLLIVASSALVLFIIAAATVLNSPAKQRIRTQDAGPEKELTRDEVGWRTQFHFRLTQSSAEEGHAQSQFDLGHMYFNGVVVDKDLSKAFYWCARAAEQDHEEAQFWLGQMYDHGYGVPRDMPNAIKWYTKAAEQGHVEAQFYLGVIYDEGDGVTKDLERAAEWYTKAASNGHVIAQFNLGFMYRHGDGVPKHAARAVDWYTNAAKQGYAKAQYNLGFIYLEGVAVRRDVDRAIDWFTKAARQGHQGAAYNLGIIYHGGQHVSKNDTLAYAWYNLAAASGDSDAANRRDELAKRMTRDAIADAQQLSVELGAEGNLPAVVSTSEQQAPKRPDEEAIAATASGFFVTRAGHLITCWHVLADATNIIVHTEQGALPATVVRKDIDSDLALLKVKGSFPALHVRGSSGVEVGAEVSTVGFPNPTLQGLAPKFSSGDVQALSGPTDDPRLLQVSIPIQPGNSGGAVVDETGSVVGVIVAQLDEFKTLEAVGDLPENVNYAVKGTMLLGVLESVPGLSEQLVPAPDDKPASGVEIARMVEEATVLISVTK